MTRRGTAAALIAIAAVFVVSGCASAGDTGSGGDDGGAGADPAAKSSSISLPPTTGGFDYQLGGGYTPPEGVTVVTRDSTDQPAKGVYSICYVNGFQTQPGETWPSALILHTSSGAPLVDPGWPDEHLLDISTATLREQAGRRIDKVVTACKTKGFEAVEFDNLDSYSRSKGALTLDDAVAFATLLVGHAHAEGLAASQKNTAELADVGHDEIGFDFVTTEECDRYDECGAFTKVYGEHVYDVEYTDDLRGTFGDVCARESTPALTILRDRDLVTPAAKAYVYARC